MASRLQIDSEQDRLAGEQCRELVQRIAAWMFGLAFMGFGLQLLNQAVRERAEYGFSIDIVIVAAMSLAAVLLGIRVFRNGFQRRAQPPPK